MAASPIPAPAHPLLPGALPALWREHIRRRAASRTHRLALARLELSLAHLLHAAGGAPGAAAAKQACHPIPLPTARRLLALLHPRPAPPAATLADLQLTLNLSPRDAIIARRALTPLASQPGFDPATVATGAFCATAWMPLSAQLHSLRRRDPHDFDPVACAALSCAVPAAQAAASPHPGSHPSPDSIPSLYAACLAARRAHRREARELSLRLPELGRLLTLQQAQLATPGRASTFGAFLRRHHIPRRTAYRLMEKVTPLPAPINCAEVAAPLAHPAAPPTPVLELRQRSLTLRLTPQQATILHLAISDALRHPGRYPPVARTVISAFLNQLPPSFSSLLIALWDSDTSLPEPRFLPPLRIFPINRVAPSALGNGGEADWPPRPGGAPAVRRKRAEGGRRPPESRARQLSSPSTNNHAGFQQKMAQIEPVFPPAPAVRGGRAVFTPGKVARKPQNRPRPPCRPPRARSHGGHDRR